MDTCNVKAELSQIILGDISFVRYHNIIEALTSQTSYWIMTCGYFLIIVEKKLLIFTDD